MFLSPILKKTFSSIKEEHPTADTSKRFFSAPSLTASLKRRDTPVSTKYKENYWPFVSPF
jgi:hypothetical protein